MAIAKLKPVAFRELEVEVLRRRAPNQFLSHLVDPVQGALGSDPFHIRCEERVDGFAVTGFCRCLESYPKLPRDLHVVRAHRPILGDRTTHKAHMPRFAAWTRPKPRTLLDRRATVCRRSPSASRAGRQLWRCLCSSGSTWACVFGCRKIGSATSRGWCQRSNSSCSSHCSALTPAESQAARDVPECTAF